MIDRNKIDKCLEDMLDVVSKLDALVGRPLDVIQLGKAFIESNEGPVCSELMRPVYKKVARAYRDLADSEQPGEDGHEAPEMYEAAIEMYEKADEGADIEVSMEKGFCYMNLERWEDAVEAFSFAVAKIIGAHKNPVYALLAGDSKEAHDLAWMYKSISDAYDRLGEKEKAETYYERFKRLWNDDDIY